MVGPPILVVGVAPRSGTNLLADLLAMHPSVARLRDPVREDHLLRHTDLLARYADRTAAEWAPRWGDRDEARDTLAASLGAGLAEFLGRWTDADHDTGDDVRPLTKTPFTDGLDAAARLLPDATVLVLVRDGRDVAASLMSGFGHSLERAARAVRDGGRRVVELLDDDGELQAPLHLVRFEDLVDRREVTLRRLLEVADLDVAAFPFDRALDAPVVGSSFQPDDRGRVTWDPADADPAFRPVGRHEGWDERTRERFDWVAGEVQDGLGYPRASDAQPGSALRHRLVDATWPLRRPDPRAAWKRLRGQAARSAQR